MHEHVIRFRGGWEWWDLPGGPEAVPRRVTLPLDRPPATSLPIRLVRSFQAPRIDLGHESLGLRLDDVPGLIAVTLNDLELVRPVPKTSSLWIPLTTRLPPRNRLVLDVSPSDVPTNLAAWGTIALVITRVGTNAST